jgi:Na+/melibiose symporter-like transporter
MSSLSGVILAGVLTAIGYSAGMAPTTEAFWGFFAMVVIIPALGHLASIIAFKYYPITKTYYQKMIAEE